MAQAGANQTQNFTALMNNFQVAIDATATAMDSAGSAMKENSSYMESLEAQTTQLKATFQDFANNVIDKELVSSILTLANDALGLLNTETGKTITQWGLLTGVLTGGLTIFGQIGAKLVVGGKGILQLGKHLGVLASAFTGANVSATAFAASAAPVAAVIAAVAVGIGILTKYLKDTNKPLSEYTSEIESANEQLKTNEERLNEINQLPWYDRTPEILAEKEALEKENEALQEQIDKLETLSVKAAKRILQGGYVEGAKYKVSSLGADYAGRFDSSLQEASFDTYEQLISFLDNYIPGASKKTREELEALGVVFEEVADEVYKTGEAYEQSLIQKANTLSEKLEQNHSLTDQELQDYQNVKAELNDVAKAHETLGDKSTSAKEALDRLNGAYEESTSDTAKLAYSLGLTIDQVQTLITKYPELSEGIQNCTAATIDAIAKNEILANQDLNLDSKIKALNELIAALGNTAIAARFAAESLQIEEWIKQGEEKGSIAAADALLNKYGTVDADKIYSGLWDKYYEQFQSGINTDNSNNGTTTETSAKKATDLALEEFKGLQKDLEHQRELGVIKEEEYYTKLEQLIKDYKAKATAHMKEYGTDVDTINRNMYQYEEEIYKGRAKLAENLAEQQKKAAEEAAKAQQEALEKQKEDFESAVSYVVKQIDKEITKLQDLRDQTEQYYDDKIDALNDANDELERQIQYEQLLNNLAQAKDKQLYVFQNGQFQYVQDVEAIASAQAELDAYERDEALRKEVENLETLKDQALASIDKQIEGWEKYKKEWESVTTQYQEQQDKLLAEQLLGIDTEQKNWETRLANVQSFVSKYNSILSQIGSGVGGDSGGNFPSGGNGYSFDYSKKTNGWTAQELLESDPEYFKNNKNVYQSAYDSYVAKGDYTSANKVIEEAKSRGQKVNKHAIGTLSAPGGLSLVGERGPELRVLNSGDGVIPADATRNLWNWASFSPKDILSRIGSDNIFHIGNIALPNVKDAQSFVVGLKQLAYQRAYKRA